MWNGINYLTSLPSSLDFLDRVAKLVSFFGFHLIRNPFVVPVRTVSLDMLPPASAAHISSTDLDRVREMENIMLEEEVYALVLCA